MNEDKRLLQLIVSARVALHETPPNVLFALDILHGADIKTDTAEDLIRVRGQNFKYLDYVLDYEEERKMTKTTNLNSFTLSKGLGD